MSEVAQSLAWIVSTAKADSALMAVAVGGVWETFADIGTPMPYMLAVPQTNNDVLTMNKVRVFTHNLFQIKMVGPASVYDDLVIGADRIEVLFADQRNIALSPGYMLSSYRESELAYGELRNDVLHVSHLGGLYHIELQGA